MELTEPYKWGGRDFEDRSGLTKLSVDELVELDRAANRAHAADSKRREETISRIRVYLRAHPTPWRIAEGYRLDGMRSDDVRPDGVVKTSRVWEVRDATAARVLPQCEPDPHVKDLVDLVNHVGKLYGPTEN